MTRRSRILFLYAALLFTSCSTHELLDNRYQPVGPSVLRANKLIKLQYPNGVPPEITSDEYKSVLREGAPSFAVDLEPYDVDVRVRGDHFVVWVKDRGDVFLIQPSCKTDEVHCWVYKRECDPDTYEDPCSR